MLPVYLIHWNAPAWCASSVRSILASQGVEVELTVVNNDHKTALAGRLPPGTRVLQMPFNTGYAGAANRALADWRQRMPQTPYSILGSHDLHVALDTLTRLVQAAEADRGLGVVGAALVSPDRTSGGLWTGKVARQAPLEGTGVVDRDWASGTCLLVRRECAESVDGFDNRFGSYLEDVDFCLRAKDLGWRVGVAVEATAWGLGTAASGDAQQMIEANSVLLLTKRAGWRGAGRGLTRLAAWSARNAAGALAPWRDPARRRISRTYLAGHIGALRRLRIGLLLELVAESRHLARQTDRRGSSM